MNTHSTFSTTASIKTANWKKAQGIAISIILSLIVLLSVYTSVAQAQPAVAYRVAPLPVEVEKPSVPISLNEENVSAHSDNPDMTDANNYTVKDSVRTSIISTATTHFTVTAPITQTLAGSAFNLTVTASDETGNVDTNYDGAVIFTSNDVNAEFPSTENLSLSLTPTQASASSTYSGNYLPAKAIDGNANTDWATQGETSDAWIQLDFDSPTSINHIVLRDRANTTDKIFTSYLEFSAGLTVTVGSLDNEGSPEHIYFSERTVDWVRYNIVTGSGLNVGLAEFEVYPTHYTFTPADNGQHTFSGAALETLGMQTITVTDAIDNSVQGVLSMNVAPGIADVAYTQASVTGSHQADGIDEATITVTATDRFDNLVPGADVWVIASGTGNIITTSSGTTDANGVYTVTLASTQPEAKSIRVLVGDGQDMNWLPGSLFVEFTGAVITGTIFSDPNRDNVQQGGEPGVGGVQISLYRDGDAEFLKQTMTAADGSYQFTGLLSDTYRITQQELGYYAFSLSETITVTATEFTVVSNTDFGVYGVAHVVGRVWNDGNQDGQIQAGEPGISNALVSAYDAQNVLTDSMLSTVDGSYQLDLAADLPVAPNNFSFSAGPYRIQEPATAIVGNFDFSHSRTAIDTVYYPQNYDFSTGDFAGWTIETGDENRVDVISDTNGIDGYYARLDKDADIYTSFFTPTADTQSLQFSYRNQDGNTVYIYILHGPNLISETQLATFDSDWADGWETATVDVSMYQGEGVKVHFYIAGCSSCYSLIDNINLYTELPDWEARDGHFTYNRVQIQDNDNNIDGPHLQMSKYSYVTSSPLILAADAQSLRFNYRNQDGNMVYMYIFHGPNFISETQLAIFDSDWAHGWKTAIVDVSMYQGEVVKVYFYTTGCTFSCYSLIDNVNFYAELPDWEARDGYFTDSKIQIQDNNNSIDGSHLELGRLAFVDTSPLTPTINIHDLQFDYRNNQVGGNTLYVSILYGPDFTQTSSSFTFNSAINEWKTGTIDLSAYQDQAVKVNFYSNGNAVLIDNIHLTPHSTEAYTITQTNLPNYTSTTSDTIEIDARGGGVFYLDFGDFIVDAYQSAVNVTPTTVVADGVATAVVTVTLRDGDNNLLVGHTVEISATGQNVTITQPAGSTNALGQAVGAVSSTYAPQTVQVSARSITDNVTIDETKSLTFTTGLADADQSSFTVDPAHMVANGVDASAFAIILRDEYDNLIAGHPVSITHNGISVTISQNSAETDASGQLTGTIQSTVAQTVTFQAYDSVDNITLSAAPTIIFSTVDPVSSTLEAAPSSLVADGVSTSVITVTLHDKNNAPLPNKLAQLQISGEAVYLNGQLVTETVEIGQSGANGVITASLTSTATGVKTIQAYGDGIEIDQQATVTFTVGAVDPDASSVESNLGALSADGTASAIITATLYDSYNHPVPDKTTLIQASGTNITVTQLLTISDGQGVVTATIRSIDVQTATVTAVDQSDGITLTEVVTLTFTPAPAIEANSTITVAPTSLSANGVETTTVTAVLRDALNRPLDNRPIALIVSGSSNIISPSSTLNTDANGAVIFYLASTRAETKTLSTRDTDNGLNLFAEDVLFNPAVADAAHSSIAVAGRSVAAPDGVDAIDIQVIARDAFGNVIPNATVALTSTHPVSFTQPPSTDQSGQTMGQTTSLVTGTAVIEAIIDGVLISETAEAIFADADIAVDKSGPATTVAGGVVIYDIVVTNHGGRPATHVAITDTLPLSTTFAGSSLEYSVLDEEAGTVVWVIDFLAAGASEAFTLQARVDSAIAPMQIITNTVNVAFAETDPTPADNQDNHTTTVYPSPSGPDLLVHKTGPTQAYPGETITYQLTVHNIGGQPAHGIQLTDTLPYSLTYAGDSYPDYYTDYLSASNQIVWQIGSLAAGGSKQLTLQATVAQDAPAINVSNRITATTTSTDANSFNDSTSFNTTILEPAPQLSLSPASSSSSNGAYLWSLQQGVTESLTVTVTNSGNITLTGGIAVMPTPTMADINYDWLSIDPEQTTGDIGVGESVTFTLTATISGSHPVGNYYDIIGFDAPLDPNVVPQPFSLRVYVHPGLTTVPVTVTNDLSQTVPGAYVWLYTPDAVNKKMVDGVNHGNEQVHVFQTANISGSTVLANVQEGEYEYIVSASGHNPVSGSIVIPDGLTATAFLPPPLHALPGLVFEPTSQTAHLYVESGESSYQTFQVRNTGPAIATNFVVTTPAAYPWVSSALPYPITQLGVGEAMSVTLLVDAPVITEETHYQVDIDVLADDVEGAFLTTHVHVQITSTGGVSMTVLDTDGIPVNNAQVWVTNPTGRIVDGPNGPTLVYDSQDGFTDPNGILSFTDLPPAEYNYHIQAEGYYYTEGTMPVVAGPAIGGQNQAVVQMESDPFNYDWNVTRINISDTYEITVAIVYEAQGPELFVSPIEICPNSGAPTNEANFLISNVGPLTMTNVQAVPTHSGVTFNPSGGSVPDTLLPGQTFTGTYTTGGDVSSAASGGQFMVSANYDADGETVFYSKSSETHVGCSDSDDEWEGWDWSVSGSGSGGVIIHAGYGGGTPWYPGGLPTPPPNSEGEAAILLLSGNAGLERQAFEAYLQLDNSGAYDVENIQVDIIVKDANGSIVEDGFAVTPGIPTDLGDLGVNQSVTGQWLIIPGELGITDPNGETFTIRAEIDYDPDGGASNTIVTIPASVTIYPQPYVVLKYSHTQPDKNGDFYLEVTAENEGHGPVQNLVLDLDGVSTLGNLDGNDRSLIFNLESNTIDGEEQDLAYVFDFGDIPAGATAVGRWQIGVEASDGYTLANEIITGFGVACSHAPYLGVELSALINCGEQNQVYLTPDCPFCGVGETTEEVGGPINTSNGNYTYRQATPAIPTVGQPLQFVWTYNSLNTGIDPDYPLLSSTLGTGWTHNYQLLLDFSQRDDLLNPMVVMRAPHGTPIQFNVLPDGRFQPVAGARATLTAENAITPTVYTITTGSQATYIFSATGQLAEQVDARGNVLLYEYNALDQLERVFEPVSGRYLEFAYTDGRLTSVTDPISRSTNFGYDSLGYLTAMTDTRGLVWPYSYTEATAEISLLSRVEDPDGRLIEETEFDSFGRAISQTYGAKTLTIDYYSDGRRVVLYGSGSLTQTETHVYNRQNLLVAAADHDGELERYALDGDLNKIYSEDRNGNATHYDKTEMGYTTAATDTLGNSLAIEYSERNEVTQWTAPDGRQAYYEYDSQGNLLTQTNHLSATQIHTYNDYGQMTGSIDENGVTASYGYDPIGQLRTITSAEGLTTTYEYDGVGRLITTTDTTGNVTVNVYDNGDHLLQVTRNYLEGASQNHLDKYNIVTFYGYDGAGRQTVVTDTVGQVNLTYYDEFGRVITTVSNYTSTLPLCDFDNPDPEYNHCSVVDYDSLGRLITRQDLEGRLSRTFYNEAGRVAGQVENWNPLGPITSTAVLPDCLDLPLDRTGNICTLYGYDPAGNTILVTDTVGNVTATFYDELNRVHGTISHWDGVVALDDCFDLSPLRDDNICTGYVYDNVGNTIVTTDTLGQLSRTYYDILGRTEYAVRNWNSETLDDPADDCLFSPTNTAEENICSHYEYDAGGRQITQTNALGQVDRTYYDDFGRVVTRVVNYTSTLPLCDFENPNAEYNLCTLSEYDTLGRPMTTTNPLGQQTLVGYDDVGRVVTNTRLLDGEAVSSYTAYDVLGRRQSQTNARGYTTYFYYDSLGRSISTVSPEGVTTNQIYNAAGQVVESGNTLGYTSTMSYDDLGRLITATNPLTETTIYAYDLLGAQLAITDANTIRTSYIYDDLRRLAGVVENDDGGSQTTDSNLLTSYTYDVTGSKLSVVNARSYTSTQTVYDVLRRPIETEDALGNTTGYAYNALGSRLVITDANDAVTTYAYDSLNRPSSIQYLSDDETVSYTYNALGSRLTMTDSLGVTSYGYDDFNRLVSVTNPFSGTVIYGYDNLGNRTNLTYPDGKVVTYTYDMDNRLTTVEDWDNGLTEYGYDTIGRLITATLPNGVQTFYTYDKANRLLELLYLDANGLLLAQYEYELDKMGNRLAVTETLQLPETLETASLPMGIVDGDDAPLDAEAVAAAVQPPTAEDALVDRHRLGKGKATPPTAPLQGPPALNALPAAPGSVTMDSADTAGFDAAAAVERSRNRVNTMAGDDPVVFRPWHHAQFTPGQMRFTPLDGGEHGATLPSHITIEPSEENGLVSSVTLPTAQTTLDVELESVTIGDAILFDGPAPTQPTVIDNIVSYQRTDNLVEEFVALDDGIEQRWRLESAPTESGDLTLEVTIATHMSLVQRGGGFDFFASTPNGDTVFPFVHYARAQAIDAAGATQWAETEMENIGANGNGQHTYRLRMTIPADWLADAAYPLLIDPLIGNIIRLEQSGAGNDQENVQVAYNPDRDEFMLVWEDYRNSDGDIYAQRMDGDGALLGENMVVNDASYDQVDPHIAYGDGVYLIAWTHYPTSSASYFDAYGAIISGTGNIITDALPIANAGGSLDRESAGDVVYNADDGQFFVLWEDMASGGYDIWGRQVSITGTLGSELQITDQYKANENNPAAAYNPDDGQYLVVFESWSSSSEGDHSIQAIRIEDGILVDSSPFDIGDGDADERLPDTVYLTATGRYLAVWEDARTSGSNGYDLYGQLIVPDDYLQGSNYVLADEDGDETGAYLAPGNANSGITLLWERDNGVSGGYDLYGRAIAANGSSGGAPFVVQEENDDQRRPAAVVDDGGDLLIAWGDDRHGNSDIFFRFQFADGSWGGTSMAHPAPGDQKYPQAAYNAEDDQYLVVWQDFRSASDWDVFGQLIDGDGSLIGENITVTVAGIRPVAAYSPDDDGYLVVWESSQLSMEAIGKQRWYGKEIWGQAISKTGTLSGTAFVIYDFSAYTGSAERPDIVYSEANGEFLAVWESPPGRVFNSNDYRAVSQRVGMTGTIGGGATIADNYKDMILDTVVAAASDGTYLAVWQDDQNVSDDIYGRILAASGAGSGAEFGVINTSDAEQQPDVAWNEAAGAYLVAWYDDGGIVPQGIQSRLVLTTGATSGSAVQVSGDGEGNNPGVVADTDGWLIGWQQPEGGTEDDLYGRTVGNNGLVDGGSFLLTAGSGDQQYPIFAGADNRFLLTWQDDREGGWDIYASLYRRRQTTRIEYEYDDLYRLTEAVYSGDLDAVYEYAYDAVGNRTFYTETIGIETTRVEQTFDAADRLSTSVDLTANEATTYDWDDAGRLITTTVAGDVARVYGYSQDGDLTSADVDGLLTTFAYDGDGRRLQLSIDGEVTTYTLDYGSGNAVLYEEGGAFAETKHYLYGVSCLGEYIDAGLSTEEWRYYHHDGNKLVRQTTNAEASLTLAWAYSPEGAVLYGEEGPVTNLGCGATYDWSTGLIFKNGQYFDPNTGIWIAASGMVVWNSRETRKRNRRQRRQSKKSKTWVLLLLLLFLILTLTGCNQPSELPPEIVPCRTPETSIGAPTPGSEGTSGGGHNNGGGTQQPPVTQLPPDTPTPIPTDTLPPTPPERMRLSDNGFKFITQFEQIIENLYDDGGYGIGNCTVGIGYKVHDEPCEYSATNIHEAPYINGITEEQARELFRTELETKSEPAVRNNIHVEITQYQYDALVSFAYNVGPNNFELWGIVQLTNENEFGQAADKWLSEAVHWYPEPNGEAQINEGLQRRRFFESELYRTGNYNYNW